MLGNVFVPILFPLAGLDYFPIGLRNTMRINRAFILFFIFYFLFLRVYTPIRPNVMR